MSLIMAGAEDDVGNALDQATPGRRLHRRTAGFGFYGGFSRLDRVMRPFPSLSLFRFLFINPVLSINSKRIMGVDAPYYNFNFQ